MPCRPVRVSIISGSLPEWWQMIGCSWMCGTTAPVSTPNIAISCMSPFLPPRRWGMGWGSGWQSYTAFCVIWAAALKPWSRQKAPVSGCTYRFIEKEPTMTDQGQILLVDDEAMVREATAQWLELSGFRSEE